MKKHFLSLIILCLGLSTQAQPCSVLGNSSETYNIYYENGAINLEQAGTRWHLRYDRNVSSQLAKPAYTDGSLVFTIVENLASLFGQQDNAFYFQNQSCKLDIPRMHNSPPAPPSSIVTQGAVGLPIGAQVSPLPPPGPANSGSQGEPADFTLETKFTSADYDHGVACKLDSSSKAISCDTESHYVVVYPNRVELTLKKDGIRYMFSKVNGLKCEEQYFLCQEIFAYDARVMSVGIGYTGGIVVYIFKKGQLIENFSYDRLYNN